MTTVPEPSNSDDASLNPQAPREIAPPAGSISKSAPSANSPAEAAFTEASLPEAPPPEILVAEVVGDVAAPPVLAAYTSPTPSLLVQPAVPGVPRIWPALLVPFMAMMFAMVFAGIVLGIALVTTFGPQRLSQNAQNMNDLMAEFAATKLGLFIIATPGQFVFFMAAVGAAMLSPEGVWRRLRLGRGRGSLAAWIPLVLATPAIGLITSMVMSLFVDELSESLKMLEGIFRRPEGWFALVLYFLIGVVPGVAEELLFRGYLQSRLEKRWPIWVAVFISALIFGLAHMDPMHSLAVVPLGLWLGVISYRTNSLWPAMLGHMVNNLVSVAMTRHAPESESVLDNSTLGEDLSDPLTLVVLLVSGLSLLASIAILIRGWLADHRQRLADMATSAAVEGQTSVAVDIAERTQSIDASATLRNSPLDGTETSG